MEKKIGHYSYIVGVVLALVLGLASQAMGAVAVGWLTSLLILLGIIVGLLNVSGKETKEFLLVSAVLIIAGGVGAGAGTLGTVNVLGPYLSGIFTQLMAFVVPATIVVALKDISMLAQNP